MRSRLTRALVIGATLVVGVAAIAVANGRPYVSTCLRSPVNLDSNCSGYPNLIAKFGGQVVPEGLPKHKMAPVAIELWGKVSTNDGTHPSALREVTIDLDRNLAISAKGLPVCHPSIEVSIQKACGSSIVGGGKADFELAFPEAPPILNPSKLTAYNAGVKRGVTTLYMIAHINKPVPTTIVTRVEIERIHEGRFGLHAVAKIPVIAGGSGSLLDFSLKVKRFFKYKGTQESYVTARCPDNHLDAEVGTFFKNEVGMSGVAPTTAIRGKITLPCTPKG